MLKFLKYGWILFFSITVLGQKTKLPHLKPGNWTGNLALNSFTNLPFKLEVKKKKSNYTFIVYNGKETIQLQNSQLQNDSIILEFPSFNSKLVLKAKGRKSLNGYWINLNKGVNYTVPCKLTFGYFKRFQNPKLYVSTIQPANYDGKWESTFEPGTEDAYKALGLFTQTFNDLEGTFLTETGDYRFLEGNVVADSLYLSCFDGSHAFLFTGKRRNDSIQGKFYSGKHWETDWIAFRNEEFKLAHPDSLTYLVDTNLFSFQLKDLEGKEFHFPNGDYKNKVTIIQIMGTWCPNCMDETRYFKDLYDKYHSNGLEIISIGYEIGNDFSEHAAKVKKLQERLNLDYQLLVGGAANKNLASEHFNMLNQIISFPTSIFIGKDGQIKKVHTGFNGPGTGQYYIDFVNETTLFVESLLKE